MKPTKQARDWKLAKRCPRLVQKQIHPQEGIRMAHPAPRLTTRLAEQTGSSFWLYPAAVLCAFLLLLVGF